MVGPDLADLPASGGGICQQDITKCKAGMTCSVEVLPRAGRAWQDGIQLAPGTRRNSLKDSACIASDPLVRIATMGD